MMQIVYFPRKELFLSEMASLTGETVFIAPSPAKADSLRTRLGQFSADVITIAKFTAGLIQNLWEANPPEVKRKADLLLVFGILKEKYLPGLGFEQFMQAYNLFSDFRSFTLNLEALGPALEEQPEEIRKSISLFSMLLNVTGFQDEHGAYNMITEALRSSEQRLELQKRYVFWGFQHLNGQQVDLIKALAIRYEVIIPFPLALKDKIKRSDWISWLDESVHLDSTIEIEKFHGKWIHTNSREISTVLKDVIQPGDQILLGVSKLTPQHLDIVPARGVFFKVPHALIQNELKEVAEELDQKFHTRTSLEELREILSEMSQDAMKTPHGAKRFKGLQLYIEALHSIRALTDEEVKMDSFFMKLLHSVVELNQPRTSYIPLSKEDFTLDLKDISSMEELDPKRRVILCVDDRFDEIQGLGQAHSESVQKILATLGPVKRNELELAFKQWEFQNLFSEAQVTVLMSESALKHSLIWKRLFSNIILDSVESIPRNAARKTVKHLELGRDKRFDGSFSASKFQTFIDCPRKFYFSYVDKVFPQIMLQKDFDPMTAGTITHEIIEKFHKEQIRDEDLGLLVKTVMQSYIDENHLLLPDDVKEQRNLVFTHRASNGLHFMRDLERVYGEALTWTMEEDFKNEDDFKLSGKIDCIGVGQDHVFLLDFKSTKSSASTGAEVEELESLQLWTYARAALKKFPQFAQKQIVLGYVVLDEPDESILFSSDESLSLRFKESKICRVRKFKVDFGDLLTMANERMKEISLLIQNEKDFKAQPRKNSVCQFCELNRICIKTGDLS